MAENPTRQDTYVLNVQIAHPVNGNMLDYGTWDKMSGGEVAAGATQYHPGGMAPPISLGGRKTTGNVTVSRLYKLGRDHDVVDQILSSVGKSKMIITKQPLNIEGVRYGNPITYKGILDRCTPPEVDSESESAGMLELEMVVEGYPSA